jgi:hypothetical protein
VDWSNERYVRLYTRDTSDWLLLSWEARSLWMHLLRKFDRSGVIDLGRHGLRGIAATVGMPIDVVERALPELVTDGCLVRTDSQLAAPNYLEAQEAIASGAQRTREYRERKRSERLLTALHPSNESSPEVTRGDAEKRAVTSGDSMPCRAVPDHAVPGERSASPPFRPSRERSASPPLPLGWGALSHSKRRVLQKHLQIATRLWDLQETLRHHARPSARGLDPTAERLAAVAERLEAGATEQECELVLRQYAAEAKQSDSRWFNGETNWRASNFTRALGQVGGSNGHAAKSGEQRASDMLDAIARERDKRDAIASGGT